MVHINKIILNNVIDETCSNNEKYFGPNAIIATQKQIKIDPILKQIPVNLWHIEKIAVGILLWILRCGDKGRFSFIFYFNNAIILYLGNFFCRISYKIHINKLINLFYKMCINLWID